MPMPMPLAAPTPIPTPASKPTPPAQQPGTIPVVHPIPTPSVPTPSGGGGCCKFGADCGDCGNDGTGWCHQSASNCATCTGTFDSSAASPSCNGSPTPGVSPTPSGGGWVQGTYTTGY